MEGEDSDDIHLAFKLLYMDEPTKTPKDITEYKFVIDEKLHTKHKKYLQKQPETTRVSLEKYKGSNFKNINTYLRTGKILLPSRVIHVEQLEDIENPETIEKLENIYKENFLGLVKNTEKKLQDIKTDITNIKELIFNAPVVNKVFWVYRGESLITIFSEESIHDVAAQKLKKGSVIDSKGFNSFSMSPVVAVRFLNNSNCCLYRLYINKNVPRIMTGSNEYEIILPPSTFVVSGVSYLVSDYSEDVKVKVYDLEFLRVLE